MKEGIQNYSEWIVKQPNQAEANKIIHETVTAITSPKFKKPEYKNGGYRETDNTIDGSTIGNRMSPYMKQLWNEHRIGIIDYSDIDIIDYSEEETSALAQLYLSYINSIVEPLGVQFNDNREIMILAKNMNFHNGRHAGEVNIHERQFDPQYHVTPIKDL